MFKSSLPDHYFQSLTIIFWYAALTGVGKIEAAKAPKINSGKTLRGRTFDARADKGFSQQAWRLGQMRRVIGVTARIL